MALAVHALQEQINAAKLNLKAVDENIKKITGKDPNTPRIPSEGDDSQYVRRPVLGRRPSTGLRRQMNNDEPPPKRPANVFRRLSSRSGPNQGGDLRQVVSRLTKPSSDYEDEEPEEATKPSIQSSVVSTAKKITKTEVINAQNVDEKGKARNRRMFGMLLGTLSRFQDDQKRPSPQMKQAKLQKQIEVRLEEESAQNRKKVIEERRMLFNERRMQRKKIELLEMKIALASEQEEWKNLWELKKGFIVTKAKPEIFYLPIEHNDKSKSLLKESESTIQLKIETHENSVLENIAKIDGEIENITHRLSGKPMDDHKENKPVKKHKKPMEDDEEEEVDLNKIPTDEIKVEQQSQSDNEEMDAEVKTDKLEQDDVTEETDENTKDVENAKETKEESVIEAENEEANGNEKEYSDDDQVNTSKDIGKLSSPPKDKSTKLTDVKKESESDSSASSSDESGSSSSSSSSDSEEEKPQKKSKLSDSKKRK